MLRSSAWLPDTSQPSRHAGVVRTKSVLEAIGRAVACGRLANRDAVAATKAVREWFRAHEAGTVTEQVTELRQKVEELKKGAQLEVVK